MISWPLAKSKHGQEILFHFFCLSVHGRKKNCPHEGECLQSNVIYQAKVTTETSTENSIGLAWQQALRGVSGTTGFPFKIDKSRTSRDEGIFVVVVVFFLVTCVTFK